MADALTATRSWLRSCPLIDKGNRFNVAYLGDKSVEYTLTTASETHKKDICGGDLVTYKLVFMARMPFGAALGVNVAAAEFFAGLSAWVREQERQHNYPAVDGYRATQITATNAGVVISAEANSAQYQLQLQLILEEE